MPKFEILGGTWGEGWVKGDIVEMDDNAAAHRLFLGEIVPVNEDGTVDDTKALEVLSSLPPTDLPLEVVDPVNSEAKNQGTEEDNAGVAMQTESGRPVQAIDGEKERTEYRSIHPRQREASDIPEDDFIRRSTTGEQKALERENPELAQKVTRDPEDEKALEPEGEKLVPNTATEPQDEMAL